MLLTTGVPQHVVFNGRIGSVVDNAMVVNTCKDVIIYHGYLGSSYSASHLIGGIWDRVYQDLNRYLENLDTYTIGASIVVPLFIKKESLFPTSLPLQLNILVNHIPMMVRKGALGLFLVNECTSYVDHEDNNEEI